MPTTRGVCPRTGRRWRGTSRARRRPAWRSSRRRTGSRCGIRPRPERVAARRTNAIACAIWTFARRPSPWSARSEAIRKSGEPSPPEKTLSQNDAGSPCSCPLDAATVPPSVVTATQTLPSPTASDRGVPPTGTVRSTAFDDGLASTIVPRSGFATHTLPSPTATAPAPSPTGIDDGRPLPAVSIRHSSPSASAVAQTAPSPTASASSAVAGSFTRRRTAPVFGSSCASVPPLCMAQTSLPEAAIASAGKARCVAIRWPVSRSTLEIA